MKVNKIAIEKLEKPIFLSGHSIERFEERFNVATKYSMIRKSQEAYLKGCKKYDEEEDNILYVQYGSLFLILIEEETNFTVKTVYNLKEGITEKVKEKLPKMEDKDEF